MSWNPTQYAKFSDHRTLPALDLLARVPSEGVSTVVDLGCGTGNVTEKMVERWPAAQVIGVDSSTEMLAAARQRNSLISWVEADLGSWSIPGGADVVYSNAALHWLPDHDVLFPHLAEQLRPGGVLAVQMPRNFGAPTHMIAQDLAAESRWGGKLVHLIKPAPVQEPGFYYDLLVDRFARVELWETEYIQVLHGSNAVLEWIKGSWLRQFLAALDVEEGAVFERSYAERAARAYPPRRDGTTVLPFKRLFMIAVRCS
ncbi:MAG: methyltransferase domain-containing protein [Burkholderiales bacterium]